MFIKTGDCKELPMCSKCGRRHEETRDCDGSIRKTEQEKMPVGKDDN